MKRRLKAYKKTVSIVDESTIALYESLGREKKGFLMESNDKENGRYTFMGVEPEALIQSDGESLVITKADGTKEVRRGNPLERLKEYYSEFEIVKEDGELEFTGGLVGSLGYDFIRYTEDVYKRQAYCIQKRGRKSRNEESYEHKKRKSAAKGEYKTKRRL